MVFGNMSMSWFALESDLHGYLNLRQVKSICFILPTSLLQFAYIFYEIAFTSLNFPLNAIVICT